MLTWIILLLLAICLAIPYSLAFQTIEYKYTPRHLNVHALRLALDDGGSTSVQRPLPRRSLKKRKNKRRERMDRVFRNTETEQTSDGEYEIETRPIRRIDAIEAGLDYWMDEIDLEKERQRKIAAKNRKAMEGQISRDKLKEEVIAPYKQNWIGIFSVMIMILSMIIKKFPELMQIPVIPIPDL
ncbi:hypothetical protein ACHAXN_010421 [Cyclotella atomus]